MKKAILTIGLLIAVSNGLRAQDYQVPVSEKDEPMMTGKFEPTWESLEKNYQVPTWFRIFCTLLNMHAKACCQGVAAKAYPPHSDGYAFELR